MTSPLSRRSFLASAGVAAAATAAPHAKASGIVGAIADTGPVDPLRARIAESDLRFTRPAARSEEGLPIGNGRMGSLVWTTPSRLHFQINRVDLYPADSRSNSFSEAHNDPCGGCAFVDVAFDGAPFGGARFEEHLSIHDGRLTITGDGVTVSIIALRDADIFAVAIDDRRGTGAGIRASLRALRFAGAGGGQPGETTVWTRSHLSTSRLHALDGAVALSQHFTEDSFRSCSAVALRFADGPSVAEIVDETTVQLGRSGAAPALLLIGSAAVFSEDPHIVERTRHSLEQVTLANFPALTAATRAWWQRFWEIGSIALRSADGVAQTIQRHYHYFLYLMASTSTGSLPPKFNGMLWNSGGDARAWGAQHWFTNSSCYYEALPATGRFALMEPFFEMYTRMAERCAVAAREQWGSQGLFIPETVYFDGVEPLPPAISAEMRALYLGRKPWAERSQGFRTFAETKHPYASAWNWKRPGRWEKGRYVTGERGDGPYGPVSHIFAATAKVAYLYWQRFEFTRDRDWLQTRAYPMLRGAVEFYRHHPLVSEGPDRRIHIAGTNNSEPVRGARDTNEDLSALRGVTAALIRAAVILDVDGALRPQWQGFLDRLAPLPTSHDLDALGANRQRPAILAAGRQPARFANPLYLGPDPNSLPSWFFDLCAIESRDMRMRELARSTFEALFAAHGPGSETWNGGLSKLAIAAAMLGDGARVRSMLAAQTLADVAGIGEKWTPLRNRLTLGEGAHALSAQHLGRGAEALHLALLQSNPPAPGEPPVLHLTPACPSDWDADFTLHARGGFVVEAAIRQGRVASLQLQSNAGERCRLRNPFAGPVRLRRNGRAGEHLAGALLEFPTNKGERIAIVADSASHNIIATEGQHA